VVNGAAAYHLTYRLPLTYMLAYQSIRAYPFVISPHSREWELLNNNEDFNPSPGSTKTFSFGTPVIQPIFE